MHLNSYNASQSGMLSGDKNFMRNTEAKTLPDTMQNINVNAFSSWHNIYLAFIITHHLLQCSHFIPDISTNEADTWTFLWIEELAKRLVHDFESTIHTPVRWICSMQIRKYKFVNILYIILLSLSLSFYLAKFSFSRFTYCYSLCAWKHTDIRWPFLSTTWMMLFAVTC